MRSVQQPVVGVEGELDAAARVYDKIENDQAETEAMKAVARTRMDVETAYTTAQERAGPNADGFTPSFMSTYDSEVTKTSDSLSSELARKKYSEKMLGFSVGMHERAGAWEAGQRRAGRQRSFTEAADNHASTLFSTEASDRERSFDLMRGEIEASLESVDLPPDAKADLRDKIRAKMSYAAVRGDLRDRPEAVQDWVIKGDGSAYYSKLRSVESGGRNIGSDTSSAFGPYQFTRGTWKSVMDRHPDLGLTEKSRFDPISQEVAIRAFTEDNVKVLKQNGLPASNSNLYMMHFLGEGGGLRFLKALIANPNDEASRHATRDQVAANGAVFKPGRTVAEVYMMFGQKFGTTVDVEVAASSPSYYNDLTFQNRNTLYNQADVELRKRRTEGAGAFKQVTDNVVAQYASKGFSPETIGEQQFVAAYGPQRGTLAYGDFVAATIGAKAQYDLKTLDLRQQAQYLEGMRPEAADPHYAEKLKGFEQARTAAASIQNAVKQDAAGYVMSNNPALAERLAKLANLDSSDPATRGEAAQAYLAQLEQEYERLGIPAGQRRTVPKAYAEALTASLGGSPADSVGATGLWKGFTRAAQAWGSEWPSVLRELGDSSSDIRVIGSGISEEVATILLVNRKTSMAELTKFLPAGTAPLIDSELQGVFADYARTLRLPGEDGSAFFAAAQKLSAVKMRDGVSSSRAADWAYDQLIGSKFTFEGDARIPKDKAHLAYVLDDAKRIALEDVDLSALPAGVTPADAKSWYASSARWVSMPDDSGLILMDGARAVRDVKGHVIARDWKTLQAMPPPSSKRAKTRGR